MAKSKQKKRKGVLGFEQIGPGVISLSTAIIAVAIVFILLATFKTATTDGNATAAIDAGITGLSNLNNFWGLLALGLVFVILFGFLFAFSRQARAAEV